MNYEYTARRRRVDEMLYSGRRVAVRIVCVHMLWILINKSYIRSLCVYVLHALSCLEQFLRYTFCLSLFLTHAMDWMKSRLCPLLFLLIFFSTKSPFCRFLYAFWVKNYNYLWNFFLSVCWPITIIKQTCVSCRKLIKF